MARRIPEEETAAIMEAVRAQPGGATISDIARALTPTMSRRTLQHRLSQLVEAGRLTREGERRWTTYHLPDTPDPEPAETILPMSAASIEIQAYLAQPPQARKPAGYDRSLLDSYRPNDTAYLSDEERAHLHEVGRVHPTEVPAGTYARQIMNRLLIDLAWNSSRLEGNTYSLLDTRRLIEFGEEAEGRERLEAQMILNHKDAIEFLVDAAEDISFNRYTILNLHALLANNLLDEPDAAGRLRFIPVAIERSVFHPLEVPQLIEECFDQLLATAAVITDPFEQAFFIMAQLPYLQPFDDVNKRVSRLAANIPLVRNNLSPLSFTDVPQSVYTEAVLGIYELGRTELMRDVFVWAYERSAARYAAVRQSLGEPDPFRLRQRGALRSVVGEVVRNGMDRRTALAHLRSWSENNMDHADRDRFRQVAEEELLGLHEGNFARYRIKPGEFAAWQKAWRRPVA